MADKKKASKANEETTVVDTTAEPVTETPATEETALARPTETSKYLQVFVSAQTTCVEKLQALRETADPDEQAGLERLMKSAKPVTRGREEMAQNWNIPTIRIVAGTTKDPSKPATAQVGDMYATNGRLITSPFVFTPLYIYETNRMFQEGQNAPICWSPDAKLGTMFGPCNRCTHQPMGKNATGERTDCNNGISMIVLAQDWKIYRIEFFKTSRKAGASVDRLVQSQDFLWERWFELKTAEVSSNNYTYHVFKTAAHGDDVGSTAVKAADALYDLIKTERDAFLDKHYEQTTQGGDAGTSATPTDENVDAVAMGISPDVDTNPSDIASGDL